MRLTFGFTEYVHLTADAGGQRHHVGFTQRIDWRVSNLRELLADKNIQRALLLLDDALELCYDVAKLSLGRSALLDAAFERATLYRGRLKRLKEINQPGFSYWYECTSRHFTLALTPLTVADKFKEVMAQKPGSWIFTSATLSVNDDLHHFTERLGIEEAESLLLPSPFDYEKQALLCVPRNLPLPNQPGDNPEPDWTGTVPCVLPVYTNIPC